MTPAFLGVVFFSLLLKAGLALLLGDLEPQYDERQFLRFAREFTETGETATLWRAPGYQWFMGLGLWLGGGHPVGIRLLQALLSTGTAILVYRIGCREWDDRAGFWAGAFVAFYPTQVAFAHLLWAETAYTFFILLAFERLLALDRSGGGRTVVPVALALLAASLMRSTGLVLLGVSVLWILYRNRTARGLKWAAAIAAIAAVGVSAWSIPASLRAGCLVVVDLNGPFNLWSGNSSEIPEGVPGLWGVGLPLEAGFDPRVADFLPDDAWRSGLPHRLAAAGIHERFGCDGSAWFQEQALAEIASHPGSFLARIPLKIATFWSPDFFLPRHLLRGWYGPLPLVALGCLLVGVLVASVVPLVGGPMALAALGTSAFRSLALAWVAAYVVLHAVMFGVSRMHFPLVPILVLSVAGLLFADSAGRSPRAARRFLVRGLPWAVGIFAAWVWIAPLVVGLYVAPAPQFAPVARVLGGLRHLPFGSTEYVAWNLASIEASVGRGPEARRILEEEGVAGRPWSGYLHARLSPDPDRGEAELRRSVEAGHDLFASHVVLAQMSLDREDADAALADLERALQRRPWDVEVLRAIELIERHVENTSATPSQ